VTLGLRLGLNAKLFGTGRVLATHDLGLVESADLVRSSGVITITSNYKYRSYRGLGTI